ncbi:MAG: diacylglycerol kinase family lipid kinase [Treponema sp.]|jgi:YegS/Rv2252/BmrU family lipid kinase|nr:diacylglycerol kinase family lipid kinase [Treponema sp.]
MAQNKRKLFIILNPIAGKGKAIKAYPQIENFLKKAGVEFEIVLTERPGHALEIVRGGGASAGETDVVTVAAGGDGTCNEVVNGLLTRQSGANPSPPLLGILPVGRGNDFAYSAQTPHEIEKALEILLESATIPLDVGLVHGGFFPDGRYFVNGVGIGFDTKVGFEAAKMNIHSSLGYVFGAIVTVAKFESSPVLEIRHDDQSFVEPSALVSVVNGRRMGGSFFMGPNALLNDGLLDFCVIKHPHSRRRLVSIVLKYFEGRQIECEEATAGRGSRFFLKALEGGMAAHCDGETICFDGKELTITCVPNALRLISGSKFIKQ